MNIETVNELIASLESAGELSIRETKVMALAKAFKQLAAENVALKNVFGPGDAVLNFLTIALRHTTYDQIDLDDVTMAFKMSLPETPATDRIVAGIKAAGRAEGINFAASRLAAAFNHGFVDKPMAEVGDVVRMILDVKADLANDPVLATDGLSGEYAEKALAEWEAVLSEGADK
ncbi:TPA: hypothetical protein ACXETB_001938 [Klebsiella pneumoniae]